MTGEATQALLRSALEHHQAGRLADAERLYGRVLEAEPGNLDALNLRGVLAQHMGQSDVAESFMRRALAVDPRFADAHYNLGIALKEQGRLEDAVSAYRESLRLGEPSPDALHNLGDCLRELARHDEARESLRQSLAIDDGDPNVHNSLGSVHYETGALGEAIASYTRAIELDPDHCAAHGNLAGALLADGRVDEALVEFRRAAELRHDHGRGETRPQRIPAHRIHHDAEQVRYLRGRDLLPVEYESYAGEICALDDRLMAERGAASPISYGAGSHPEIAPSFNRFVHLCEGARAPGGALNRDLDVAALESAYLESRPEIVVVDDFLSREALSGLRAYCLESTVWKRSYDNGYLSAKLGHGFESPLLLQISEELRTRFPRIFADHRLAQAWAFKYDSRMHGVNLHADFAAVNVNFWITPESANRRPDTGGLIIWDEATPRNWGFGDYNRNTAKMREFLHMRGARPVKVAYRGNRAIVFNSTLFHETDRIDFDEGYENRRINVTLLYGRGLRTA